MPINTFWMLTAEAGGPPTKRHLSLQAAKDEAARIVTKTGTPVVILQAVEVCNPVSNVQWDTVQTVTQS